MEFKAKEESEKGKVQESLHEPQPMLSKGIPVNGSRRFPKLFRCLHFSLLPFTFCLGIAAASAQGYPNGPVRVIVPFPPGGGVDSMGRFLSQKLYDSLGKTFPIENRSGANGKVFPRLS